MNIRFVTTLGISTVAHILAISPLYSIGAAHSRLTPDKTMVVDYLAVQEVPSIEIEKASPREAIQELQKAEPPKELEIRPSQPKESQSRSVTEKIEKLKARPHGSIKAEAAMRKQAKAEAKIKTSKEYVNYYQLIRDKIRRKLKENYSYYYSEGDVHLVFVLRADGSLPAYDTDRAKSTKDETLLNIATVSLIEAAPFAPFPKALSLPKMTFNLVVSFKKQ